MATFGAVNNSTTLTRAIQLNVGDFGVDVIAPPPTRQATPGSSTPTARALLFDATNETARFSFIRPIDWDTSNAGLTVVLNGVLNVAESNNDTWDMTMDYVATQTGSGNGPAKTSTQITASTTVTTANGLAAGDLYQLTFTLSAGDATNPLNSSTRQVIMEIHLTNTTGVGAINIIGGRINYTALY